MQRLKNNWHKVPATIRKPLIVMISLPIIAAGIVMLVTPGPGWAGIFLGFAILATEFTFAEKVRDWLVDLLKTLIDYCLEELKKPWKIP